MITSFFVQSKFNDWGYISFHVIVISELILALKVKIHSLDPFFSFKKVVGLHSIFEFFYDSSMP